MASSSIIFLDITFVALSLRGHFQERGNERRSKVGRYQRHRVRVAKSRAGPAPVGHAVSHPNDDSGIDDTQFYKRRPARISRHPAPMGVLSPRIGPDLPRAAGLYGVHAPGHRGRVCALRCQNQDSSTCGRRATGILATSSWRNRCSITPFPSAWSRSFAAFAQVRPPAAAAGRRLAHPGRPAPGTAKAPRGRRSAHAADEALPLSGLRRHPASVHALRKDGRNRLVPESRDPPGN